MQIRVDYQRRRISQNLKSDFVQVHVIVSLIVFANLEQTKITYISECNLIRIILTFLAFYNLCVCKRYAIKPKKDIYGRKKSEACIWISSNVGL